MDNGAFSYSNIPTNTTTVVKSGAGILHAVTINTTGTTTTATIYDNTSAAGTKIATINSSASHITRIYDVAFSTGLTIVTAGTAASDITVSYK